MDGYLERPVVPTRHLLSEEIDTVPFEYKEWAIQAAALRWYIARMSTEQLADLLQSGEGEPYVKAIPDLVDLFELFAQFDSEEEQG